METKRIGLILACIVLSAGFVIYAVAKYQKSSQETAYFDEYNDEESTNAEKATEQSTIVVYITGEVQKPDVYDMPESARLVDLIERAGGFTENAYKDNLNLAMHIKDGKKFVVSNINDVVDKNGNLDENIEETNDNDEAEININTADAQELKGLSGIGNELAGAIIAYRDKYGDFTSIEEIKEVDGIGDGIFEKIKDSITVD